MHFYQSQGQVVESYEVRSSNPNIKIKNKQIKTVKKKNIVEVKNSFETSDGNKYFTDIKLDRKEISYQHFLSSELFIFQKSMLIGLGIGYKYRYTKVSLKFAYDIPRRRFDWGVGAGLVFFW